MSYLLKLPPDIVGQVASWAGGAAITRLWCTGHKSLRFWLSKEDGVTEWVMAETYLGHLIKLPTYLGELKGLKLVAINLCTPVPGYPKVAIEWLRSLPRSITKLSLGYEGAQTAWIPKAQRAFPEIIQDDPRINMRLMFPKLITLRMVSCNPGRGEFFSLFQYPSTLTDLDLGSVSRFSASCWSALPIRLRFLQLGVRILPEARLLRRLKHLNSLILPELDTINNEQLVSLSHSLECLVMDGIYFTDHRPEPLATLLPPNLRKLSVLLFDDQQLQDWVAHLENTTKSGASSPLLDLRCETMSEPVFPASVRYLGMNTGRMDVDNIRIASDLPPQLLTLDWDNSALNLAVIKLLPKSIQEFSFIVEDPNEMEEIARQLGEWPNLFRLQVRLDDDEEPMPRNITQIPEWLKLLPPSAKYVTYLQDLYCWFSAPTLGYNGWYSLTGAMKSCDLQLIECLVAEGAIENMEEYSVVSQFALYAIERGSVAVLQIVLDSFVFGDEIDSLKISAVATGNIEILKLLSKVTIYSDETLSSGGNSFLLIYAVTYGHIEVLEWLTRDPVVDAALRSNPRRVYFNVALNNHQYRVLAWLCLRTNTMFSFDHFLHSLSSLHVEPGDRDPCPPLTIMEEMGVSFSTEKLLGWVTCRPSMTTESIHLRNRIRAWVLFKRPIKPNQLKD